MKEFLVVLFDEDYATGFVVKFEDLRLVDLSLGHVSLDIEDALLLFEALEAALDLRSCHRNEVVSLHEDFLKLDYISFKKLSYFLLHILSILLLQVKIIIILGCILKSACVSLVLVPGVDVGLLNEILVLLL